VGEALHRDHVAVAEDMLHGLGEGEELSHCGCPSRDDA
jgi:hypothetical protein